MRFVWGFFLLAALTGCGRSPEGVVDGECTDGVDNDGDGRSDCDDPDCIDDVACSAVDTGSDTDTDTDSDTGTGTDTGTDAGTDTDTLSSSSYPLENISLYVTGCGQELWMSWDTAETFELLGITISNSAGYVQHTRSYQDTVFEGGFHDTWLVIANGMFRYDNWLYEFDLADHPDLRLQLPVTRELPPPTGIFTVDGVQTTPELLVTVTPSFSGDLHLAQIYDSNQCWMFSRVYAIPAFVSAGSQVVLPSLPPLASGTWYIALRGGDVATSHGFYDRIEIEVP